MNVVTRERERMDRNRPCYILFRLARDKQGYTELTAKPPAVKKNL